MPLEPFRILALVTALVVPGGTLQAAGAEQATPQEVVQKVQEAVLYLTEAGEAGLAKFRGKDSDYVWKDTYIFISDCDQSILLAHPIMPEREGQPIAAGPTYGGVTAAWRASAQCEAGRKPGGGVVRVPLPQAGRDGSLAEDQLCAGRPWDAVCGRRRRL